MTKREGKLAIVAVQELLTESPDVLRDLVRGVLQEFLEAEMDETLVRR